MRLLVFSQELLAWRAQGPRRSSGLCLARSLPFHSSPFCPFYPLICGLYACFSRGLHTAPGVIPSPPPCLQFLFCQPTNPMCPLNPALRSTHANPIGPYDAALFTQLFKRLIQARYLCTAWNQYFTASILPVKQTNASPHHNTPPPPHSHPGQPLRSLTPPALPSFHSFKIFSVWLNYYQAANSTSVHVSSPHLPTLTFPAVGWTFPNES